MDLHIRAYKRRHGVSAQPSMDDDCGIATAFADPHNGLQNIDRYQITVERAYLRAVETLRKTQNARLRRERRIGFLPQPVISKSAAAQSESPSVNTRPFSSTTHLISYDRHERDCAQEASALRSRQHEDDRVYGPRRTARPGA